MNHHCALRRASEKPYLGCKCTFDEDSWDGRDKCFMHIEHLTTSGNSREHRSAVFNQYSQDDILVGNHPHNSV